MKQLMRYAAFILIAAIVVILPVSRSIASDTGTSAGVDQPESAQADNTAADAVSESPLPSTGTGQPDDTVIVFKKGIALRLPSGDQSGASPIWTFESDDEDTLGTPYTTRNFQMEENEKYGKYLGYKGKHRNGEEESLSTAVYLVPIPPTGDAAGTTVIHVSDEQEQGKVKTETVYLDPSKGLNVDVIYADGSGKKKASVWIPESYLWIEQPAVQPDVTESPDKDNDPPQPRPTQKPEDPDPPVPANIVSIELPLTELNKYKSNKQVKVILDMELTEEGWKEAADARTYMTDNSAIERAGFITLAAATFISLSISIVLLLKMKR